MRLCCNTQITREKNCLKCGTSRETRCQQGCKLAAVHYFIKCRAIWMYAFGVSAAPAPRVTRRNTQRGAAANLLPGTGRFNSGRACSGSTPAAGHHPAAAPPRRRHSA